MDVSTSRHLMSNDWQLILDALHIAAEQWAGEKRNDARGMIESIENSDQHLGYKVATLTYTNSELI